MKFLIQIIVFGRNTETTDTAVFNLDSKDSHYFSVILPVSFSSADEEEDEFFCVRHTCEEPSPVEEHEKMLLFLFPPLCLEIN